MKKQNSANSIRNLFFFMLFILIIFAATLSFANVNCVIETAYAEELSETQILSNTSIGKGIQINALDQENNITLEADSDNWFNYDCIIGGAYGFKINYTNVDMRDHLDFYVESANGEVLESRKKILPAITTGQRKSIVYHITLKAGTTYNFNIKFSNAGFDYLDTGLIISQWNQYDKITLNNDKIIDNGSSQNIYHLVAGQTYVINFTYLTFSSGTNIPNILYYDTTMKDMVYKNDKSITENVYGENRDTVNGDKITVKTDKIGQIGTIYFVDHVQIYSVKFEIVDKPYTVSPVFDHVNFKLSLSFIDSYGKAVSKENLGKIISNVSLKFENDGVQHPINNFAIDMNDLPFWREEENLSVIVNYAIPWYGNENYQYTETYSSIKVETPILDAKKSSEVSTNKRIKIINLSSNQHIKISGIVEAVILENFNVNNVTFDINVTHDINVFINNLTLTTNNSSVIKSTASNLNLYLKGSNTIKGKILSNEYLVEALGVKFTGSGSVQIIGDNGANGSDGTSTSINGSNGENGTNALKCTSYSVLSGNVTILGGNGGNGGNGYNQTEANGLNGGKGGNGGNAGYGIWINGSSSYDGFAGRGGDGGKGGDGADGQSAYITSRIYGYNGLTHDTYGAGLGSRGGDGGSAGKNGNGNTDSKYSNPRGGNGGNGGKGGNGCLKKVTENGDVPPPSIAIPFSKIYKLPPANGGNGGNGGFSDYGDGGNGGNGGRGGSGYDGIDNDGSNWQGGSGASGGSGGSGGGSTNGNRGKNGSNGSTGYSGNDGTEPSCVAEGTLITLADGTQKAVEDLTGSEQLLVWNLFTGKFDTAPILFVDHDEASEYEVINLTFSDGTMVKVISEHGFWDFDLNEYVFLRSDAAKYIGHWFNKQTTAADGSLAYTRVQLVGVTVQKEVTTAWSPVTYGHLCYYVNGMLSMPGATTGLINIFNVDTDTMKIDETNYNEDIAEYGLFTYEEFEAIYHVPEVIFEAFGGKYLKVSIGKGLITIDELNYLIHRYAEFFAMN